MIDYYKIADSISFYEASGYPRIESPWTVTKEISKITAPPDATYFTIEEKNKVLVASGEQSFLYLYVKGFLPKGKFQTVTPCFRDELFDPSHTKYFIKNELIITDEVGTKSLDQLVETAAKFFSRYVSSECVHVKRNSITEIDIEINGVEVGSYGIRECDYLKWIYGTACAEPRLTYAINKK